MSEVIAEVPLAAPTMQAVQGSWMGLVTRRASGVGLLWVNAETKISRGGLEGAARRDKTHYYPTLGTSWNDSGTGKL